MNACACRFRVLVFPVLIPEPEEDWYAFLLCFLSLFPFFVLMLKTGSQTTGSNPSSTTSLKCHGSFQGWWRDTAKMFANECKLNGKLIVLAHRRAYCLLLLDPAAYTYIQRDHYKTIFVSLVVIESFYLHSASSFSTNKSHRNWIGLFLAGPCPSYCGRLE